jgi:hypothetical protein
VLNSQTALKISDITVQSLTFERVYTINVFGVAIASMVLVAVIGILLISRLCCNKPIPDPLPLELTPLIIDYSTLYTFIARLAKNRSSVFSMTSENREREKEKERDEETADSVYFLSLFRQDSKDVCVEDVDSFDGSR